MSLFLLSLLNSSYWWSVNVSCISFFIPILIFFHSVYHPSFLLFSEAIVLKVTNGSLPGQIKKHFYSYSVQFLNNWWSLTFWELYPFSLLYHWILWICFLPSSAYLFFADSPPAKCLIIINYILESLLSSYSSISQGGVKQNTVLEIAHRWSGQKRKTFFFGGKC